MSLSIMRGNLVKKSISPKLVRSATLLRLVPGFSLWNLLLVLQNTPFHSPILDFPSLKESIKLLILMTLLRGVEVLI